MYRFTKYIINFVSLNNNIDGEGHEGHSHELPQHFEDDQLSFLIDPVLRKDDVNNDGLIDYAEFIAAQIRNKMDAKTGIKSSSR